MAFIAKYNSKSLSISVSKDELDYLLVNGFITSRVELGKMPVDAGNITITLSIQAQTVLREILDAEKQVFAAPIVTSAPAPEPEKKEVDDGKEQSGTGENVPAADNV